MEDGIVELRSLLDIEGPVEAARQGRDVAHAEDGPIKAVRDFRRKAAALQETKWLGQCSVSCR